MFFQRALDFNSRHVPVSVGPIEELRGALNEEALPKWIHLRSTHAVHDVLLIDCFQIGPVAEKELLQSILRKSQDQLLLFVVESTKHLERIRHSFRTMVQISHRLREHKFLSGLGLTRLQ